MSINIENAKLLEIQKKLCDKYAVDFEKVKVLNSDLIALVEKGVKKKALEAIQHALSDIDRSMNYWREIFYLNFTEEIKQRPREKSLLALFLYLLLVEGIFSRIIQVITFMLMENDHDIYNPRRLEFVKSYEQLEKVDLFVKLQFIKKHGFDLLADSVDANLRNNIAHLNLIVKADGNIFDKKTGKPITDLELKMDRLGCMCTVTLAALGYSLKSHT